MERINQSLGRCIGDIVFHTLVIFVRAREEMAYCTFSESQIGLEGGKIKVF